jgi:hypothetical protein
MTAEVPNDVAIAGDLASTAVGCRPTAVRRLAMACITMSSRRRSRIGPRPWDRTSRYEARANFRCGTEANDVSLLRCAFQFQSQFFERLLVSNLGHPAPKFEHEVQVVKV